MVLQAHQKTTVIHLPELLQLRFSVRVTHDDDMDKHTQIGVATLTQALPSDASAPVQLLPAGSFRARDGRPTDVAAWVCTKDTATRLIQQVGQLGIELPVDYEHQTLSAATNGLEAPAAGWFSTLSWQEGEGVFMDVAWTDKAKAYIAANEYRYISPVFTYSKATGEVIEVLHAALTNTPALTDMAAVALSRWYDNQPKQGDANVNELLKKLLAQLGLPETTSETDALAACSALKAKADGAEKTLDENKAELAALKAGHAAPDPAKFVPISMYQAAQAALSQAVSSGQDQELSTLIAAACVDGRLIGDAAKDWAQGYGKKDLEGLKKYLASMPGFAALRGTQTGGNPPPKAKDDGAASAGLTENQLAVCKRMNIKPGDYAKSLAAASAGQ